jgi:lauroyl/myristoyl acyltransferase
VDSLTVVRASSERKPEPGRHGRRDREVMRQDDFWRRYSSLRALGLGYPVEGDEGVVGGVASVLESWLGLDTVAATHHAGRWTLLRRDAALHEMLARRLAPADLAALLDTVSVEGIENIQDARSNGRGVVFLSLHYSLYASVLVLWLARAASRGLFNHLSVLYVARPDGKPEAFLEAMRRSDAAEFISSSTIRLIDLGSGAVSATRNLVAGIESGGAALIFSDRLSVPGADKRAVTVSLADREIGIARGVPWLTNAVQAPVVPVFIHPSAADRHAIVFGPPERIGATHDSSVVVRSVMQFLIDRAVHVDPDPWDGWASVAQLDIGTASFSA